MPADRKVGLPLGIDELDSELAAAVAGGARSDDDADETDERGSRSVWRQLLAFTGRWGRPARERTSAEMTTQLVVSRGQALREAHRRLHREMQQRPALRQVTPHLSNVERALRKHGSRGLFRLPLPVLRQGMEQLSLLQRSDASAEEENDYRVLRLRLAEAIALRTSRVDGREDSRQRSDLSSGVDVRDISVDEFYSAAASHRSAEARSAMDSFLPDSRYADSRIQDSRFPEIRETEPRAPTAVHHPYAPRRDAGRVDPRVDARSADPRRRIEPKASFDPWDEVRGRR